MPESVYILHWQSYGENQVVANEQAAVAAMNKEAKSYGQGFQVFAYPGTKNYFLGIHEEDIDDSPVTATKYLVFDEEDFV